MPAAPKEEGVLHPIRVLMTEIVDYAGLFPPASLDMATTVANWAEYVDSDHAWMLGRLIVPVARLGEFEGALAEQRAVPGEGEEAWRLSALVSLDGLDEQIDRIFAFNREHALGPGSEHDSAAAESNPGGEISLPGSSGGIVIDAIELKCLSAKDIDLAMRIVPEQLEPFLEVSPAQDVRGLVAAMAGTGAKAKIRTGSVKAEEIPSPGEVASFISACAGADVGFKATAGLHHPLRAEYALTYEDDPPRGVMFGFLNVFLAAAFMRAGEIDDIDGAKLLDARDPGAFTFDDDGISWRSRRLSAATIARVRETFATSFGSCSFEEPVSDLVGMKLLAGE